MEREKFLIEGMDMLEQIYETINGINEDVNINDFNKENTMLVIIDMNKGFANHGALYSDRVEGIIGKVADLAKKATDLGIEIVAFTDYHTEESPEFGSYPEHCMYNSDEWELVDELKKIKEIKLIKKNSTNGFIEKEFNLMDNIENVIVVGDCTDICIYQFAVACKTDMNRRNLKGDVIVPKDMVETYDAPFHKANFMNQVFLNSMISNGVKVVKTVK